MSSDDNGFYSPDYSEHLGWDMRSLMTGLLMTVLFAFLLAVCWKYCSYEEEKEDKHDNEQFIIVCTKEIQPGLVVLQGSEDGRYRILQAYDAVQRNQASQGTMSPAEERPPPNYDDFYTPARVVLPSNAANAHALTTRPYLIQDNDRPPAYSPRANRFTSPP